MGNVVHEAWVHRVPIVAAASQGPAWLIEDGKSGLLVPVDDPSAMAAAFRRLLDEPKLARRIAARGRARFEADFTEAVAVGRYLALFDKLLAGQAGAHAK